MTRRSVARRLLSLLRPLAPLMITSSVCRVVNQGLAVAIPAVAVAMIVQLVDGGSVAAMVWLLTAMAVAKGLFRYLEQFTGHAVAFRLLSELRIDVYRHIEPLAPAGLETERTGDLVARIVGDVDRVEPFYAHTIAPLAGALIVPVLAASGLAVMIDPQVALAFVPFPLVMALVVPWVRWRTVAAHSMGARRSSGEAGAVLTDAVQGSREIAALGAAAVIADRVDDASIATNSIRARLARIGAVRSVLTDLLAGAAVVAVAAVGVARLEAGFVDVAGLAAALVVAWVGTAPARALEDIVPDLEQALAAAERLFELEDRPVPVSAATGDAANPTGGEVSFQDVEVVVDSRPVLSDLDVHIDDRSLVAVVGPSGSGKSTMVDALIRFRDPQRGRIRVGGVDVGALPEAALRSIITVVPQRPELFFGTIGDNLRLADPEATDDALWAVLDRAVLAEWVRSLPDGLGSAVGELGDAMSGGQRQRLSIARALLRDPLVLVLDEATSELDIEAERQIWAVLQEERLRRTVIVVAHRLESVTDADEILVMDRGRLVERGTHDQLVERDGVYAALWRRHMDVI